MNIFVLDLNPKQCAIYHCDKHVIKMILEHVQLLCTAHNINGSHAPYRITHKNHPCAIWVRESRDNYDWLVELTSYLHEEYQNRYNAKLHKSFEAMQTLSKPTFLPIKGITARPLAMPEECKLDNDPVSSYRNYYITKKSNIATWKNKTPEWFYVSIYLMQAVCLLLD